jgi:ribosomal protein S12 methylthiotransferase accessory factor
MSRGGRGVEALVSPHTGIVTSIEEFCRYGDEPPLVGFNCGLADTSAALGVPVEANAGSLGYERTTARAAALGEAAERYSASWVPPGRVVRATAAELGRAAIRLERLQLFAPWQHDRAGFRAQPAADGDVLGWVAGRDLSTGAERFVPAQLVYLGYAPDADEPWLGPTTSNGLACGTSIDMATRAGLLEAVERDAFMLTWRRRAKPLGIALGSSELREVHDRYFARARATYDALDLSPVSGVPTVLCVVRDRPGGVALAVGAASGASMADAWLGALSEGFQTYSWARQLRAGRAGRRLRSIEDLSSFADHVAWYADPAHDLDEGRLRRHGTVGLDDGAPPLPAGTDAAQTAELVRRLGNRGQQLLVFDVTSPDLADIGLHVVRVLGPDLCWLDQGARYAYLGRPRLSRHDAVPVALSPADTVDPDPHPFP